MWCGKCQADVAAEVSPDNQRVFCTVCGALLNTIDAPPSRPMAEHAASDKTKDARELLARWSSGKVLDPFGPLTKRTEVAISDVASQISTTPALPMSKAVEVVLTPPVLQPITVSEATSAAIAEASGESFRDFQADIWSRSAALAVPSPLIELPSIQQDRLETPQSQIPQSDLIAAASTQAPSLPTTLPTSLNPVATSSPVTPLVAWAVTQNAPTINVAPVPNPFHATLTEAVPAAKVSDKAVAAASIRAPSIAAVSTTPAFRLDVAHPQDHFASATQPSSVGRSPFSQTPATPFASQPAAHESPRETRKTFSWIPSWDPAVWRSESSGSGNWSSFAGQFLAYAGVLGLTAGACMVIWSYFGGPVNYAPTGWLLATAGQMLLFFGVVTLVSGGLEQTTEQVNRRIEQLGDHIIRIEQAARELSLRGSVPPAHFSHDQDAAALSRDERAVVEEQAGR